MKTLQYQQRAVNELVDKTIRLLNDGGSRQKIVFEAPTGAGKTVMACQALATLIDDARFAPAGVLAPKSKVIYSFLSLCGSVMT